MDGAVIGKGSIVGGGALVPEGKVFPPGVVLVGVPAKVIAERDSSRENRLNAWHYQRNASFYLRGEQRGDGQHAAAGQYADAVLDQMGRHQDAQRHYASALRLMSAMSGPRTSSRRAPLLAMACGK